MSGSGASKSLASTTRPLSLPNLGRRASETIGLSSATGRPRFDAVHVPARHAIEQLGQVGLGLEGADLGDVHIN